MFGTGDLLWAVQLLSQVLNSFHRNREKPAMMKAMQAQGIEWGEDYRGGARQAVVELLHGRIKRLLDEHLERMAERGQADRPNGCYRRPLTELGEIELAIPRTRTCGGARPLGCGERAQEPKSARRRSLVTTF